MKAVLFCRVSSKEQEETGYSLDSQEKLLKIYSERKGFEIAKIFSISESAGGKKQREIFNQMIAYVLEKDIKIIVCEKVDRLTRNFKDAVWIDEWLEDDAERQVHLVKDSLILHKESRSQEKLNWGIRILFAKNYIDNLSEEVKKGYKEKIEQGWMPHISPVGYKSSGEERHKIHVLDENKCGFVKEIFTLYATGGYSLQQLSDLMFKKGLRSERGNKLNKSKIHEILRNPFYTGRFRWGEKIYQGKHERLISDELFEQVNKTMQGKNTNVASKRNFLFKRLVRCAECGGLITWEEHKGYIYGHCNHYKPCSQKTWVKEDYVEEEIYEAIKRFQIKNKRIADWILKALKDSHKDEIENHEAKKNEINKQIDFIQNRIERLYDDKLDGIITTEFYAHKYEQLAQSKGLLTSSLDSLSKTNSDYYQNGVNVYELSQTAPETYKKADNDNKRQILRIVFEKMILDNGKLRYTYSRPFQLLSMAVEGTNRSKLPENEIIGLNIFEQPKKTENMDKLGVLEAERTALRGRRDSNSQPLP